MAGDLRDWSRVFILGNSGSGKSWLAEKLADQLGWTVHHLDDLRWKQESPGEPRDNLQVVSEVEVLSREPYWIMEGVYGRLAEAALPRTSTLIWTDLPVDECVENVKTRGPQGGEDDKGFQKTIAWTEKYAIRQNSSCLTANQRMFGEFRASRGRITSRSDMDELLRSLPPL